MSDADCPVTKMTGLLFYKAYTDYVTGIDGEIPTYLQWLEVRILAAEAKLEAVQKLAELQMVVCGRDYLYADELEALLEQTK